MSETPPKQPIPGSDVFVSYASQDAAVATSIVEALERNGTRCWIAPRDVVPGSLYADGIVRAISGARVFVLVLSEHSVASSHVGKEIERASSKRKPIIALHADKAPLPPAFEYFLSESQWIDLGPGGVDAAAAKLDAAIQRHLQSQTAPEVHDRSPAAIAKPTAGARTRWLLGGGAAALLLALAYFAVDRFWLSRHLTPETPATVAVAALAPAATVISNRSIAVLPFTDMSEKKDQEYLADGMAEEIINLLARVPDLHVPARTSSFYFKGKSTKIPDIARELSVANVLEGSIRRSGNHLRVTAQLIRADSGYHLWSETYDRDVHDVFKVQDDIANTVVQTLQITLMGGPLTRQRGGTQNLEAYQLFLRGIDAEWQNTRSSLAAARDYFEQALRLDPQFGLAWAELSRDTVLMTNNGTLLGPVGYERARQQAQHALQLSPDLAEAHAMLQYVHRVHDFDWAASEAEGRQALALDPTNPTALMFASQLSRALGRWGEAEQEVRSALTRDPFFTIAIYTLGTIQYNTRRFPDAEATFRRLLAQAPNFLWTRTYLGKTLLAEGQAAAALELVQHERDDENRLRILPMLLQAVGRKSEADEALASLVSRFGATEAYFVALNYAYRNDNDRALEWLDRAYNEKATELAQLVGEPLFSNLAADPRYKAFLHRMNLPES